MKCPKCNSDTAVMDSRPHEGTTHRRRECVACPTRFSTVENVVFGTVALRPLSMLGRPKPKLQRNKSEAKRKDVRMGADATARILTTQKEAAEAAGLTLHKYKVARSEARREAVRNNEPVELVFQRYGVLTPREKALLSSNSRPTVDAPK